jgi:XTP/dITP diphosphohydrolase
MTIVLATRNLGKFREMEFLFRTYLPSLKDVTLTPLADFADAPQVAEDGATFHENARLKALEIANFTGCMTIADDSGLEVDALDGAPGVRSARYAGEYVTDDDNVRKLLFALDGVSFDQRGARFVCVVAVALPNDVLGLFEGVCHGVIAEEPRGGNGFGYDPVFVRTDSGKTFAELPHRVKNRISHRTRAFEKAAATIERYVARLQDAEQHEVAS